MKKQQNFICLENLSNKAKLRKGNRYASSDWQTEFASVLPQQKPIAIKNDSFEQKTNNTLVVALRHFWVMGNEIWVYNKK